MAKTYGVGIMGAGNISAAYLRLAPLFRNLEVRAIADIIPEAAKKRAEEYNVAAQTPDELLKNSELDVIVNLTIPSTHFSVSKDILSAGKHAYSEKPFVLSVEEGIQLKALADEHGAQGRLGARHLPRRRAPAGPRHHRLAARSARSPRAPCT